MIINCMPNGGWINMDEAWKIMEHSMSNACNEYTLKQKQNVRYDMNDMTPKDILQNNDATVFFWNDGTKTVVKREDGTPYSLYYAYCCAMAKRMFGSTGKVDRVIEKIEKRKKKEREQELERKRAEKEKKLIAEHHAAKRAAKKAARESKTQVVRKLNDIDRKLDGVLSKR